MNHTSKKAKLVVTIEGKDFTTDVPVDKRNRSKVRHTYKFKTDRLWARYFLGRGQTLRKVWPIDRIPQGIRKSLGGTPITRNTKCPCGSGRKFKRCCILAAS